MKAFPRFVYLNNGPLSRAGGTYDSALVVNEMEYSAALDAGWFDNLQDAIDAPVAEKIPAIDAPPTRKEMDIKAASLGLKVDGRMSDKTVLSMIEKALEV